MMMLLSRGHLRSSKKIVAAGRIILVPTLYWAIMIIGIFCYFFDSEIVLVRMLLAADKQGGTWRWLTPSSMGWPGWRRTCSKMSEYWTMCTVVLNITVFKCGNVQLCKCPNVRSSTVVLSVVYFIKKMCHCGSKPERYSWQCIAPKTQHQKYIARKAKKQCTKDALHNSNRTNEAPPQMPMQYA